MSQMYLEKKLPFNNRQINYFVLLECVNREVILRYVGPIQDGSTLATDTGNAYD